MGVEIFNKRNIRNEQDTLLTHSIKEIKSRGFIHAKLDDLVFYAPSRIKLQDNQFIFSKNVGDSRELEMWEISNPFLAESMMAMGDRIVKHTFKGLGLARGFKTFLTRGVTYDPGFFLYANLLRDSVSSSILSKDGFFGLGGGAIPIVSTGKGLMNQIRQNGIVKGKDGKLSVERRQKR